LKNQESEGLSNSQENYGRHRQTTENKSERLNDNSIQNKSVKNMSNNNNNTSNNRSVNNKTENQGDSERYVLVAQKSCPDLIFVDENNEQSDTSLNKYNLKPNYTQADMSRYVYEQNLIQLFQQQEQENNQGEGNNEENFAGKDKPKSINISRISEVSHSKENSDPHANKHYSKGKKKKKRRCRTQTLNHRTLLN